MATGSKVGQPHNSSSAMADSKGGQSTHLPRWKESTERNTSFDPEKVITSKKVTPKVINLVEPASYLPSARSSGYVDPEERRGQDPELPLKGPEGNLEDGIKALVEFFKFASQESITHALREIGTEAIAALFRRASEEFGTALPGPEPAAPSPAPRPADAPPLWGEGITGREVSPVDWIKLHYRPEIESDVVLLSLAELRRVDRRLVESYLEWVEEHPDQALVFPKQVHTRHSDEITKVTPPSFWKKTVDLTPEEQARRRAYEANKKRQQRLRKRSL
jgi:hypothetical protein